MYRDFWEVVTALSTLWLAGMGTAQIAAIRNEARKERTLAICDRYYFDPVIDRSARRLSTYERGDEFQKHPRRYIVDAVTVLNYLDSIAVGIERCLYDEDIAREQIRPQLVSYYDDLLKSPHLEKLELDRANYEALTRLYNRWTRLDDCIFTAEIVS